MQRDYKRTETRTEVESKADGVDVQEIIDDVQETIEAEAANLQRTDVQFKADDVDAIFDIDVQEIIEAESIDISHQHDVANEDEEMIDVQEIIEAESIDFSHQHDLANEETNNPENLVSGASHSTQFLIPNPAISQAASSSNVMDESGDLFIDEEATGSDNSIHHEDEDDEDFVPSGKVTCS